MIELNIVRTPRRPTNTQGVVRDRFGRPLIQPPGGGKGQPFCRTTTYIDVLDDKTNLYNWKLRKALEGAQKQPLVLEEFGLIEDLETREGKQAADKLVGWALDVAGSSHKAEQGTALHAVTEDLDRGLDPFIPPDYEPSLEAYLKATRGNLEMLGIEEFVVHDELKVAGTFDRLARIVSRSLARDLDVDLGEVLVDDVKTYNTLAYGHAKTSMQLAIYGNAERVDLDTWERSPLWHEGVNKNVGLITWMPSTPQEGDPLCALVPSNIKAGYEAVMLATEVREHRKFWNRKAQKPDPVLSVP